MHLLILCCQIVCVFTHCTVLHSKSLCAVKTRVADMKDDYVKSQVINNVFVVDDQHNNSLFKSTTLEHSGSGLELRALDEENASSNPVLWC